jgi:hypothetical protein
MIIGTLCNIILPMHLPMIVDFYENTLHSNPQGNEKVHFAKVQEVVMKDVHRSFGVVQAPFTMVFAVPQDGGTRILHHGNLCGLVSYTT